MVGGGIFSVLGLTVEIAGGGAYISFIVGGLVALVTGYSYAKLSSTYPSRGGTSTFLDKAFSVPVTAGTFNVLLWLGYFVMLALYAYAFGAYTASIFDQPAGGFWHHILSSSVLVAFVALNGVVLHRRGQDSPERLHGHRGYGLWRRAHLLGLRGLRADRKRRRGRL